MTEHQWGIVDACRRCLRQCVGRIVIRALMSREDGGLRLRLQPALRATTWDQRSYGEFHDHAA